MNALRQYQPTSNRGGEEGNNFNYPTSLSTSYNGKIYDETERTNSNPILFYDLYL